MAAIKSPTVQKAMEAARADLQTDFVGPFVAPNVAVEDFSALPGQRFKFSYYQFDDAGFRAPATNLRRTDGQEPTRLVVSMSDASGTADEYSCAVPVDIAKRNRMNAYGIKSYEAEVAAPALMSQLMTQAEARVLTLIANASVFTEGVSGSGPTYWNDDANDPLASLETGMESVAVKGGKHANTLVLSVDSLYALRRNARMRSLWGDSDKTITPSEIATKLRELLLVNQSGAIASDFMVLVAGVTRNTANIGQTASYARIYTNKAWLGYVERTSPSLMKPSACYTYEVQGLEARQYEVATSKVWEYEASHIVGEASPKALLGYRFAGMVQ